MCLVDSRSPLPDNLAVTGATFLVNFKEVSVDLTIFDWSSFAKLFVRDFLLLVVLGHCGETAIRTLTVLLILDVVLAVVEILKYFVVDAGRFAELIMGGLPFCIDNFVEVIPSLFV